MDSMPLLEWLANNYKSYGAALEIVTDRSQEGAQFVRGFGGIGGLLRYRVDFQLNDLLNIFPLFDLLTTLTFLCTAISSFKFFGHYWRKNKQQRYSRILLHFIFVCIIRYS
ncbi:unnamed protein product [Onchocerca ochengi]|nr:unnamed protein product [Onchocerca ochengi]